MDMKKLTRPFETYQIKERQGRKNMFYKYVPSEYVVDRLNEIGPENWSFVIKESKEVGNEVVVLGSLRIGNTIKEAYGSAAIDDNRTAGDSFKTAQMLSLVKCSSLYAIPAIFHTTQTNQQQNQYNNYQQPAPPVQQRDEPFANACEDCGVVVSQAVVNFSRKYPDTYQNKVVCQECQQSYRNNMRRIK